MTNAELITWAYPARIKDPDPLNWEGIIYSITNKITGWKYIGKTEKCFNKRYTGGKWWKYTKNKLLLLDLHFYEPSDFEVKIIHSFLPADVLIAIENDTIMGLRTLYPFGYNLLVDIDPYNKSPEKESIFQYNFDTGYMKALSKKGIGNGVKYFTASSGYKHSQATRKKMSDAHKGVKLSKQHREALSRVRKGVGKGEKRPSPSKATLEKRSKSMIGKNTSPIIQTDKDGNIIREFESIKLAGEVLGFKNTGNISAVCRGVRKSTGGFYFKYKTK